MFGPNTGYGAIQNLRGDVGATPLNLNTVTPPATSKIVLLSAYMKIEGGDQTGVIMIVTRISDGLELAQFVRYRSAAGVAYSSDFPNMIFVGGLGEGLRVAMSSSAVTRILGYVNYVIV